MREVRGVTQTQQPCCNDTQISAWLRGLLTIAWADGHYDPEERAAIEQIAREQIAPNVDLPSLEPISPTDLAVELGDDPQTAENFLRTAAIVALADGVLSASEVEQLRRFQTVLATNSDAIDSLEVTAWDLPAPNVESKGTHTSEVAATLQSPSTGDLGHKLLDSAKHWLDDLEIEDRRIARFICNMVPAQCPFERNLTLFGNKTVHIPPMCKLNPLYDQLMGLRFRALTYLAEDCKEDVSRYC